MSRVELSAIGALVLVGGALILLDWPATATDEDEYMPHALDDVAHARNPYATTHSGEHTVARPWGEERFAWETTYPYLPLLLFLQIPGVDYRWSALVAYGALLLALRGRRVGFWAFANPLVTWLAASGFNDFAPLALVAWSTRASKPWLAWLAAASKQFFLPLLALDAILRREWRTLAGAVAFTALVCIPFVAWDPGAFFRGAILVHGSKAPVAILFWNYWLYPLYAATVMWPARRARGAKRARSASIE